MGNGPSKPNIYRRPRYNNLPPYNPTPETIQPSYNINGPPTVGEKTMPIEHRPIMYDNIHEEYVDVVGSDAGNMTVFSWITQIGTCCAAVCTLIVLIAFVIWMFLNRNINALP